MILWYLFTASICCTAFCGDKILEIVSRAELRALIDSTTHGFIGAFSWGATLSNLRNKQFVLSGSRVLDIAICGILASAIDLDHFFEAKSLSISAALSLEKRPLLHCTSFWILLLSASFILSAVLNARWLSILSCMTVVAVLSHHIRDATRRGLWLWPLGSTQPIPYYGYIFLLAILPVITGHAIRYLDSTPYHYIMNV